MATHIALTLGEGSLEETPSSMIAKQAGLAEHGRDGGISAIVRLSCECGLDIDVDREAAESRNPREALRRRAEEGRRQAGIGRNPKAMRPGITLSA